MRRLLPLAVAVAVSLLAFGQRRTSTPVGVPDGGHNYLLDSLPSNEFVDSMAAIQPKAVKNIYPRIFALDIGIDLWPALQRALQSHHGIGGIEARLSLHNRYLIALEAGISQAHITPQGMNYTFRQPIAPYFKVGMDYNFLYNSNPDYRVTALVRYGLTPFAYRYTDVTLEAPYWDAAQIIDFPQCRSVSGYIEVGAALQVKLAGPLSAGWSIRYHSIVHHNAQPYGQPWVTPGYGVTSGHLGVTLTITYTIPLSKKTKQHTPIDNEKNSISGSDPGGNL